MVQREGSSNPLERAMGRVRSRHRFRWVGQRPSRLACFVSRKRTSRSVAPHARILRVDDGRELTMNGAEGVGAKGSILRVVGFTCIRHLLPALAAETVQYKKLAHFGFWSPSLLHYPGNKQ